MIRRIATHHTIRLVVVSQTVEEDRDYVQLLRGHCASIDIFEATPSGHATAESMIPSIVRNDSEAARLRVAALLAHEAIDVIHVEGYYMFSLLPVSNAVPTLLTEQNLEHLLDLQRAGLASTDKARAFHVRRASRTLMAARTTWRMASLCALLTEEDRHELLRHEPDVRTTLVPDGRDHDPDAKLANAQSELCVDFEPSRPTVLFVGNFAYEPNLDAAQYLCREIAPLLLSKVPSARFLVVGNSGPERLQVEGLDSRIRIVGRVSSLKPFYDSADCVVCPLRIGGGIKVKMIEALAHGKAIVTTSIGAQGLGDLSEVALVCDDALSFAIGIQRVLSNREVRSVLEANSRRRFQSLPRWSDAADLLIGCYDTLRHPPTDTFPDTSAQV